MKLCFIQKDKVKLIILSIKDKVCAIICFSLATLTNKRILNRLRFNFFCSFCLMIKVHTFVFKRERKYSRFKRTDWLDVEHLFYVTLILNHKYGMRIYNMFAYSKGWLITLKRLILISFSHSIEYMNISLSNDDFNVI